MSAKLLRNWAQRVSNKSNAIHESEVYYTVAIVTFSEVKAMIGTLLILYVLSFTHSIPVWVWVVAWIGAYLQIAKAVLKIWCSLVECDEEEE